MIGFIKKLLKDRRGNTLAIAAATMPLMIGAAGLASDTIQWTLWKRQLQRAADSAAMSGVYDRNGATNGATTNTTTAVCHDLSMNLHTWMKLKNTTNCASGATPSTFGGYNSIGYTTTDCPVTSDATQMKNVVCVTLQVQQPLPFSSMFMSAAPIITASATAASVPGGAQYCVIGLDPSKTVSGITISGSTTLDLGDCSLIADSANPTAAASNGTSSKNGGSGSSVTAASIAAVGQINYSSNWNVKTYAPSSEAVADPFASYKDQIPTGTGSGQGCDYTGITISKSGNVSDYDRTTDVTGKTYCMTGDQTVAGTVKLGAATYVINAGSLGMNNSNASLSCDGCTIILTNFSDPTKTGSVNLTGGKLSLSPPRQYDTTGSDNNPKTVTVGDQKWKGIALYQDPRATDDGKNSPQNKINGNTALSVQGVVYFGNQSLEFVGGGTDNAACLQVVAKRVTFSGNSKIKAASACGAYGEQVIGGGRRVRLVA